MVEDIFYKNFEKSRLYFNSIMDSTIEQSDISEESFLFHIQGKVIMSSITHDRLKEIEIEEENNAKDSIASIGINNKDFRQLLAGASYYLLSISDAKVTDVKIADSLSDDIELQEPELSKEKQYLYIIENYIAECSKDDFGERIFHASSYNSDDYDFDDSSSLVSVSKDDKDIKSSTSLTDEIPVGTVVELEISYGQLSFYDDIADTKRFMLRSIKILEEDYFLDEKPSVAIAKEIIKNNNETVSALLADNDRVLDLLGMTVGLYDRQSVFHLDKDSRIAIPKKSFPKTVRQDEDMELLESFFLNPENEDEREKFRSTLETIIDSLSMIDLYKFVMAYMELPTDIKKQTAKVCYIEWQSIIETLLSSTVNKIRKVCLARKNTYTEGFCIICSSLGAGESHLQERKCCRYNISVDKARTIMEKFQKPDFIIKRNGDEIESETPVNDNTSTLFGRDLLGLEDSVYKELIVAYGVRNIFVHKSTSRMTPVFDDEIRRLEADPHETLDRLEQNCKKLIKGLYTNIIKPLNEGRCLREYFEYTDR